MSIPSQEIENATLSWISTFPDLLTVPKDFDSLSDGVVLTEIMTQIAPTVFSISNINMEAAEDWAFKLNNLTYLFEGLEKFYSSILGKAFEKTYVDVIKVSKNEDKEHLFNLVELVLGAAVQCDNKELYINAILTLDENCQNALMYLIEKILNRCNDDQQEQQPEPQTSTEAKTEPKTIQAPPELVKSRDSDFINRSSFLIPPKQDGHVKSLLAKIEELENENNQLSQKVNELAQERDTSTMKMAELLQELNKKNEDVRNLVVSKEGILEKLTVQESHEELHNELKMKEYKILELTNFVDELKQKHQMELSLVQDELEEQKRKVLQLSKMEGTLEFYKQKFEDYSRIALQMSDMEKQSVTHRNKIEELSAYNENLTSKVNVYREKIEHEKTRNISLDVELTRRATEISSLKNEKKRLESLISELESKLQEQSKIIERHEREFENKRLFGGSIGAERYAGKAGGQDFQEIIQTLEKENENLRLRQNEGIQPVLLEDGEAEILKKENEIIKAKCKEIESENENLRKLVATSEDVKYVDRITNDNQVLKQEVEKVKKAADTAKVKAQNEINALKEFHAKLDSNPNEEMQKEIKDQIRQEILEKEKENEELKEANEKLQESISELNKKLQESRDNDKKESEERNKENLNLLKQEINSKAEIINKLNEKMTGLQASVQATQNLEEELDKKDTQIKELINDIDMMKTVIEEVGEQKEEELRVLSTALQELAIRNVDLERQINSLKGGSAPSGLASKNKVVVSKIGQRI